jgi:coenzyme F420-0:L-glutamate ligase/coenzyme F420-1:gamma-L-glutamate ligase
MNSFTVYGVEGIPLVKPGDDLSKIIIESCSRNDVKIEDGDIVVISQKILSKAEGRVIDLKNVSPSRKAKLIAGRTGKNARLVELVLKETKKWLRISREILLVEDKRGLVCINAGIDKSNVEGVDNYALLPADPDLSAEVIQKEIFESTGKRVAVVVCDTYSRPFRRGQVNFAIGIAGIEPFKDYRGKRDMFGQILKVKNVAVVDEIAGAAELLMGQASEAIPVVVIRGLKMSGLQKRGQKTRELLISRREDLFKKAL